MPPLMLKWQQWRTSTGMPKHENWEGQWYLSLVVVRQGVAESSTLNNISGLDDCWRCDIPSSSSFLAIFFVFSIFFQAFWESPCHPFCWVMTLSPCEVKEEHSDTLTAEKFCQLGGTWTKDTSALQKWINQGVGNWGNVIPILSIYI